MSKTKKSKTQPYLVTITETYQRTVVVHAEDNFQAEEIAYNLCNDDKIEIDCEYLVSCDAHSDDLTDHRLLKLYPQFDENGEIKTKK